MQILVTGGRGFIGSHLLERLKGRYEVVVVSRPPNAAVLLDKDGIRIIESDLFDLNVLRRAMRGIDVVIHLAGLKGKHRCLENAREALAVNIMGTQSVLSAARAAGVGRFIFASSYWVYGRRYPGELPCREEDELRTCDLYGMTKAVGEELVKAEDIDWTILRLGHVYGPDYAGTNWDVIATFFWSALNQNMISVCGSGRTVVDPIYVDDTCELIERLLHTRDACKQIFNVGGGCGVSIRALAGAVARTVPGVRIVHEGEDDRSEFDKAVSIEKILACIPGFGPRSLSQGLEDFYAILVSGGYE